MILLIDLSLGLYEQHFFWTKDKYFKFLKNYEDPPYFWSPYTDLDDKFKYKEISRLLFKLDENIKNDISAIFVLNLDGSLLTKQSFKKFQPDVEIIKKVKFYNFKDFGWSKDRIKVINNLWGDKFLLSWGSKVLNDMNEKKVLLVGEYITPIILALTSKLNDYDIYRRTFFNLQKEGSNWQKVKCDNVPSYLKYLNYYYSNSFKFRGAIFSVSDDPTFQKFFFWSAQHELNKPEKEGFYKSFLQFRDQNLKLQIIGDDDYFVGKFTKALRSYYGGVHPFDCSDGSYEIKKGKKGLIFYSVDKLSKAKRSQLVTEIIDDEYKKKPVFFVTTEPFDVPHLPRMKKTLLPSFSELKEYFPQFFFTIIMEKEILSNHNDIQFYRNIYAHLMNGELLKDIFNSVKSLTELDKSLEQLILDKTIHVDLLHQDFWYEFIQNFSQYKSETKIEEGSTAVTKQDENQYVFRRLPNKHFEIVFNHQQIYPSNPNSDGLFYIYTIIRQAAYEPIHVSTLYELKLGMISTITKKKLLSADDFDSYNLISESNIELDEKDIENIRRLEAERDYIIKQKQKSDYFAGDELSNEFKTELIEIEKELQLVKLGKKKKRKTLDQKRKKAIDKAIKQVKDEFQKPYPDFYNFLDENIVYNYGVYSYSYKNIDNISWIQD